MRTRLDEIVEEEFEKAKPEARFVPNGEASVAFMKRITTRAAERAFRHGVEQGNAANMYRVGNVQPAPVDTPCDWCGRPPHKYELCGHKYVPSRPVQPAPAGETPIVPWPVMCERTVRSAREAAALWERGLCPRCGCGPTAHDRRKGERRKGNESREWDGMFCAPLIYGYRTGPDRRSGKDRRK